MLGLMPCSFLCSTLGQWPNIRPVGGKGATQPIGGFAPAIGAAEQAHDRLAPILVLATVQRGQPINQIRQIRLVGLLPCNEVPLNTRHKHKPLCTGTNRL